MLAKVKEFLIKLWEKIVALVKVDYEAAQKNKKK